MEGAEALSQPRASHPKVAKNFKAASGGGGPSDAPDRLLKVLTTASQKAMVGVGERLEEKRKAAHEARYSLTPVITSKQKDVRGLSGSQSMAELSRSMPTGVGLAAKGLDAVRTPVQGAIRPRTTNLTTRDQQQRPSFSDRPRTVGDGVGRSPRDSGHSGGQVYKVRYREMVQPERLPTPGARSITPLSTPGTTKPTTPASGASPRAGTTSPPRDGSPPQKWSESTHNAFESHYAPRKLQAGAAVLSVSRAGPTRASTPAAASTQGDEPPFIDMSFVYKPDRVTVKNAFGSGQPSRPSSQSRSTRPPSQQQLGWGPPQSRESVRTNSPPQPLNMGATNRPWSGYSEGPCAVSGMAMTMEALSPPSSPGNRPKIFHSNDDSPGRQTPPSPTAAPRSSPTTVRKQRPKHPRDTVQAGARQQQPNSPRSPSPEQTAPVPPTPSCTPAKPSTASAEAGEVEVQGGAAQKRGPPFTTVVDA